MTNFEKHRSEILSTSLKNVAVDKEGNLVGCTTIICADCQLIKYGCDTSCQLAFARWLCEDAECPTQVDWSSVPVDTLILVRKSSNQLWIRRYFSHFNPETNEIFTWCRGCTSKTTNEVCGWSQGQLIEEE